jgi:PTS system nitrogen regulatory IIA component
LDSGSKKKALEDCAGLVAADYPDISERTLIDQLMERERLGSTAIGEGVAIPHCRLDSLPEIVGAFVTLSNPVEFDSPDQLPVDLVFMLLVPSDETESHLSILSKLAATFGDPETRQTLRSIRNDQELYETMRSLIEN